MATLSEPQPHTCEHCQRVLLDKPIDKDKQYESYTVTLPHSRYEAYQAAEAGCPLFTQYPKLPFYNLGVLESLNSEAWQPFFSPLNFLKFPGWQRRHATALGKSMLNPYSRPFEVIYDTEADFSLRCASWLSPPDQWRFTAPAGRWSLTRQPHSYREHRNPNHRR